MGAGILQAIKGMLGGGGGNGGGGSPSPNQDVYLKYTKEKWDERKNAFIVYHQAIWETFLFYAGQSYVEWDDSRKVFQPQQPTDDYVPMPRINRFSPTVDAVASNIYQIPEVEAIPIPDDDPTANMVARVATKLAEHFVQEQGLKFQSGEKMDKSGLAAQLFVLCGGVFSILRKQQKNLGQQQARGPVPAYGVTCPSCQSYSTLPADSDSDGPPETCPQCGGPLEIEDTEMIQPQIDETGQPVMQEQTENEIVCDIGNNLFAFPRPGATSIEDSPDILWAQRHPLDTIHFRWNFEAQADTIWPDGYAVTYEHALNFWYTGYSSSAIQVKDSCMVLEMYASPGKIKDSPEGFHAVVINDKIAHAEPWDYPEHPLTLGHYLTLPTIFFPRSISFDLVEIQRQLNKYESVILLHAMTSAVDPVILDANTIVSEITGRSDRVIKWRPIGPNSEPPHRMSSGHLDDGIYKQRDNLHAEFQNISMAVNAFRGEQEGAITAAAAIQQLRSQAELMFSKPVSNWNNFWRETIRKAVRWMQKYYTMSQIIRIVGPDMETEVRAFMAADLKSSTNWVASTHGLPRTRDEKRQELMMLWDKGALDINDPSVRQKIYDLFGETGMMKSFNKDATRARLENMAMKEGKQIKPMPLIEDMAIHLYFHKDQAKSLDFDKWPDQSKEILINHIVETTDETIKMAMAQQLMAGGGEGEGEKGQDQNPKSKAQGAQGAATPPGGPGGSQ
jgi:hypothetical protein